MQAISFEKTPKNTQIKMQILTINNRNFHKLSWNPSNRTRVFPAHLILKLEYPNALLFPKKEDPSAHPLDLSTSIGINNVVETFI